MGGCGAKVDFMDVNLMAQAQGEAAAPITIFQGATTVGAIISGSTKLSTSQTQNVIDSDTKSDPPPQYQEEQLQASSSSSSTAPLLPPDPRLPPPTTPPPRHFDTSPPPIPGTPPAPPPVPPSRITFPDHTPIDTWFRQLRTQTPSTLPRYSYLLPSNILDLDDPALPLPRQYVNYLIRTTLLPPLDSDATYAFNRFPPKADLSEYRAITETCPRPPGAKYTHLPTYINHALSHHLTLIEKFAPAISDVTPLFREGFFDSSVNPWFIDNLFLGGNPGLFLSRKEIASFIVGCAEKFDAVVRFADGVGCVDLGVVEVKGGNGGGGVGDGRGERDIGKVLRAMGGMAEILKGLVYGNAGASGSGDVEKDDVRAWEVLRQVQVLGIVNSGFNVTIMRMMYITPNVRVLRMHRTARIGLHIGRVREVFPLLKLLVQCRGAIERTLDVIIPYLKREGGDSGEGEEDL